MNSTKLLDGKVTKLLPILDFLMHLLSIHRKKIPIFHAPKCFFLISEVKKGRKLE